MDTIPVQDRLLWQLLSNIVKDNYFLYVNICSYIYPCVVFSHEQIKILPEYKNIIPDILTKKELINFCRYLNQDETTLISYVSHIYLETLIFSEDNIDSELTQIEWTHKQPIKNFKYYTKEDSQWYMIGEDFSILDCIFKIESIDFFDSIFLHYDIIQLKFKMYTIEAELSVLEERTFYEYDDYDDDLSIHIVYNESDQISINQLNIELSYYKHQIMIEKEHLKNIIAKKHINYY